MITVIIIVVIMRFDIFSIFQIFIFFLLFVSCFFFVLYFLFFVFCFAVFALRLRSVQSTIYLYSSDYNNNHFASLVFALNEYRRPLLLSVCTVTELVSATSIVESLFSSSLSTHAVSIVAAL